jgi:hypothetical protein
MVPSMAGPVSMTQASTKSINKGFVRYQDNNVSVESDTDDKEQQQGNTPRNKF